MKNLFLSVAFMLLGTFTFANTLEVETINKEKSLNYVVEYFENGQCTVSYQGATATADTCLEAVLAVKALLKEQK
jgi:hypothetical protein